MNIRKFGSSFVCTSGINNRFEKTKSRKFVVNADSELEVKFQMINIINTLNTLPTREVYKDFVLQHEQKANALLN